MNTGTASNPTCIETISAPAGKWCSSYQAELVAMIRAIRQVNKLQPEKRIRIVSDSKSVLEYMRNMSTAATPPSSHYAAELIDEMMSSERKGHTLDMVWCPSHCGVLGNEMADNAANEGAPLSTETTTGRSKQPKP